MKMTKLSNVEQALADRCLVVARQRFGENVSLVIGPANVGCEARIVGAARPGPAVPPAARGDGRSEALESLLSALRGVSLGT